MGLCSFIAGLYRFKTQLLVAALFLFIGNMMLQPDFSEAITLKMSISDLLDLYVHSYEFMFVCLGLFKMNMNEYNAYISELQIAKFIGEDSPFIGLFYFDRIGLVIFSFEAIVLILVVMILWNSLKDESFPQIWTYFYAAFALFLQIVVMVAWAGILLLTSFKCLYGIIKDDPTTIMNMYNGKYDYWNLTSCIPIIVEYSFFASIALLYTIIWLGLGLFFRICCSCCTKEKEKLKTN